MMPRSTLARWPLACVGLFLLSGLAGPVARGQQKLRSFDGGQAGDLFGRTVTTVGDLNGDGAPDLLIGARDEDTSAPQAGAAYLYSGADGSLLFRHLGEATGDAFSVAVVGLGLVNGDSIPDYAVGARSHDSGGIDAGRVYIYSGATHTLLSIRDGEATLDRFGWTLAAAGDVDGDGRGDLLVGAPRHAGRGRVYLYSGATLALLDQYDGEVANNHFGIAMAGAGDVDGDGIPDVMMGAPFHASNSGRAYVYSGWNGALLHQWDGEHALDQFGVSMSPAGDINSDGRDDVIIGAIAAGPGFEGKTYFYSGADGSLLFEYVGQTDLEAFASSISAVGDVDADGFTDFMIGATGFFQHDGLTGTAHLYSGRFGQRVYRFDGEADSDRLGISASAAGDLDQDGLDDVVVGAYLHDSNGPDSGRVYEFAGSEIFLHVDPKSADVGTPLTITTSGGDPGDLCVLTVAAVDGVSVFYVSAVTGVMNAAGQWTLQGAFGVHPGFSSVDFATMVLKNGHVMQSKPERLLFP